MRSEDGTFDQQGFQNEYLVEEDNWIAAAEYADSLGTDIINTSLGYSTFNNPDQNHTYQDMNGISARISKAAEMASDKGMIVVVSAGNEGSSNWRYISAPADAHNILAVGAVNSNRFRAGFSSTGPSFDNRVKPDVMAIGQGTYLQTTNSQIV
ncbi:MAG: S8 family serine peptidase, partial [Bacteroidales bacterium]|nr:S8 family serine peptidase [Bacteroidales bacterium]